MDIVYTFQRFDETLSIEIGKTHPKLDAWVQADDCHRWMILTAENPWGEEFPKFINKQRTTVFRNQLIQTDLSWVEGVGQVDQPEEDLPSEVAFLIWGLTLEQVAVLAREDLHQSAVVTGVVGGYAEIIALYDGGDV